MSKQLPELQRQVKLDATIPQDYTQAYGALAAVPSALGQFGARMAQDASNAFSAKMGYEAGKNPKGSLLPPITQSDAAYVKAYEASAQATLTVNGQEAMLKGQLLLAQQPKISEKDIGQYHANMRDTIDQQIAMAPDGIKASLKQSLDMSLARSTANLSTQLIKQNHQDQVDNATLYVQSSLSEILETAKTSLDDAKKMVQQYNSNIDTFGQQNIMNKLSVNANKESAMIAMYTGQLIGDGKKAQHNELKGEDGKIITLGQHMAKVNDMEFKGLPFSAQEQIKSNYMKQMSFDARMNAENQQSIISKGVELIASDKMTTDYMSMAKANLTEAQFSQLNTKFIVSQRAAAKRDAGLAAAISVYKSPQSVALPESARHQATQALVTRYMQEHKDADEINALGAVLSTAGADDPVVTKVVNQNFVSGSAQDVNNATRLVNYLHASDKALNLPLNSQSASVMAKYQVARAATPGNVSDDEVLSTVRQALFNKSTDQIEANNVAWNEFRKQNLSDPASKMRFTQAMLKHNLNNFENPAGTQRRVEQLYELNYRMNDGNEALAEQVTQRQLSIAYGQSEINGDPSFVLYPVEKMLGVGRDGLPYIWADMAEQFQAQVKANNDNKNSPIKYEISNMPDIRKLGELTKRYEDLSNKSNVPIKDKPAYMEEIRNIQREISAIKNSGPPTVIKRTGKQVEEYKLGLRSSPPLGISVRNHNQMVGDWDLVLVNKEGTSTSINGTYNLSTSTPYYRPNLTQIHNQFSALTHAAPETYQELAERYRQYREAEEKGPMNMLGKGMTTLSKPSALGSPFMQPFM